MKRFSAAKTCVLALFASFAAPPVQAEDIALSSSFRVGDSGVRCTAQNQINDPRLVSMFDRSYAIVCRDAATPVGKLYALKAKGVDASARAKAAQNGALKCGDGAATPMSGQVKAWRADCTLGESGLTYVTFTATHGGIVYAAEGLAGYESALRLGLQSLLSNRALAGEVSVATTNADDPVALARLQAGSLETGQARVEGYQRNVEGSFAEASEYFETLALRSRSDRATFSKTAEYLANNALQQSNLGNFPQADALFAQAVRAADVSDPLIAKLLQNFKAIHFLNQKRPDQALSTLAEKALFFGAESMSQDRLSQGYIDIPISQRLTIDGEALIRLGGGSTDLTVGERQALLDGQALYLKGVALRLTGQTEPSRAALIASVAKVSAVRGGAVTSMAWLRASSLSELSWLAEKSGDLAQARQLLDRSLASYLGDYPGSATALAARSRLAGLMLRTGESAAGIALFRDVVKQGATTAGGGLIIRSVLGPYLDQLVKQNDAQSADDFFAASQALLRPGVAQTQAIFARELSGGSDEAATLFRQSVSLSREIVRADVEIASLTANAERSELESAALNKLNSDRAQLATDQTAIQAKLAIYPRYRVLTNATLNLADLQAKLDPGEAYYKLVLVENRAFAILVEKDGASISKIGASVRQLEEMTAVLRDSILKIEDGEQTTLPFDIVTSRKLYVALFESFSARLKSIDHLIFEPDGPLLQIPATLLVADQKSVDAYQARAAKPNADPYDFRGTAWLGRAHIVSTAVSPQAFVDVRAIPASKAKRRYLGLGTNALLTETDLSQHFATEPSNCDWPQDVWGRPISGDELRDASAALGGVGNSVVTQEAFSDTALLKRTDLADFRVIQFATHGLVTAPSPECPARPALVTSFGGPDSDGLLQFKEIFELRLDADTIILSACDTAGAATAAATREAGIATGGNYALDGLVRAFVGAGARSVIASHWPVPDGPDSFFATKRLMTGLLSARSKASSGEAMRQSQIKLMDDADTSHPWYWAGFSIIGDAKRPIAGN